MSPWYVLPFQGAYPGGRPAERLPPVNLALPFVSMEVLRIHRCRKPPVFVTLRCVYYEKSESVSHGIRTANGVWGGGDK